MANDSPSFFVTAGLTTAAPVLGAVILPKMAAQLPSLGLVAAAGATTAGFGCLFALPLLPLIVYLDKFSEKYPTLFDGLIKAYAIGASIAAVAAASAVLHQAFIPLLLTSLVGYLVIEGSLWLLKKLFQCSCLALASSFDGAGNQNTNFNFGKQ